MSYTSKVLPIENSHWDSVLSIRWYWLYPSSWDPELHHLMKLFTSRLILRSLQHHLHQPGHQLRVSGSVPTAVNGGPACPRGRRTQRHQEPTGWGQGVRTTEAAHPWRGNGFVSTSTQGGSRGALGGRVARPPPGPRRCRDTDAVCLQRAGF